jgi:hypothetical protein
MVPVVVLGILEAGMVAVVCVRHIRQLKFANMWNWDSFIAIIFRDSIFYYLGIVSIWTSAFIVTYVAPIKSVIPIQMITGVQLILVNRLILNLRETFHREQETESAWGISQLYVDFGGDHSREGAMNYEMHSTQRHDVEVPSLVEAASTCENESLGR